MPENADRINDDSLTPDDMDSELEISDDDDEEDEEVVTEDTDEIEKVDPDNNRNNT